MKNADILHLLKTAKQKTFVKVYIEGDITGIDFGKDSNVINMGAGGIITGNWDEIKPVMENSEIKNYYIESDRRNSAIELLDIKSLDARIEPGAVIREGVTIEKDAVVMMGACINIGVHIGEKTLIDMNAVIGGGAYIGKRCHVGAGAVIKGVISSPDSSPVWIEDDVIIGANVVIMEGVKVGKGSVIRAGAVVKEDIAPGENV